KELMTSITSCKTKNN
ncbi:hypothetical protein D046_2751B, partial [Vibrio parahaemolyticus V-223/04]